MGLDIVELVMRVEEDFSIDLPTNECEQVRTVGDLYRLILTKLNLEYRSAAEIEQKPRPYQHTYVKTPLTTAAVWYMVKDIIIDQLQVDPDDIREDSSFSGDLGAD